MIEQHNHGQSSNLLESSLAHIHPHSFTTQSPDSSREAASRDQGAPTQLSLASLTAPDRIAGIVSPETSPIRSGGSWQSALSLASLTAPDRIAQTGSPEISPSASGASAEDPSLSLTGLSLDYSTGSSKSDNSVLSVTPVFEKEAVSAFIGSSPDSMKTDGAVLAAGISVDQVSDGGFSKFGLSLDNEVFLPEFSILKDSSPSSDVTPPADKRSVFGEKIANVAQTLDGRKPWTETKYEPQVQRGRLAGAAAVSTILQQVGYEYADSANVGTLSNQLIKQGWKAVPLSDAKPGDVVYGGKLGTDWRKGGGNAHVGIVGNDGRLWHNQSSSGEWRADSIKDSFPSQKYGDQVWVLRPPESPPSAPNPSDHRPSPRTVYPSPETTPRPGIRPLPDSVRPGDDTRPNPEEENLRPSDKVGGKNAKILSVAQKSVDRRLWAISDFANSVKGGKLGCAASVSEVLKASGYRYANSAGVGGLVGILKQHGWTRVPLSEARAGDVVYGGKPGTRWWEGGGNAHVGIVGEDSKVYHNSSGRRRWVQDDLTAVFNTKRFGDQRYVMRPPNA